MANVVVVGAQWGDEGKGKIVDWLSEQADIVVRFSRGTTMPATPWSSTASPTKLGAVALGRAAALEACRDRHGVVVRSQAFL